MSIKYLAFRDELKPFSRGATIKIAASNAAGKSKAAADYVCSGAEDEQLINGAIQELDGIGGCVELSEGTFDCAGDILVNVSNILIRGQGGATVISMPAYQISVSANKTVFLQDLQTERVSNFGTAKLSNCIFFDGVFNSGVMAMLNCESGTVDNMVDGCAVLNGNTISAITTRANIYPSTTDLLKQTNKVVSVQFIEG